MSKDKPQYKTAVGIIYNDEQDETPTVAAKGDMILADEVVKVAKRFGIPVVEKPQLARALKEVEDGEPIPEELFEAMAIVLSEIEEQNKENKNKNRLLRDELVIRSKDTNNNDQD